LRLGSAESATPSRPVFHDERLTKAFTARRRPAEPAVRAPHELTAPPRGIPTAAYCAGAPSGATTAS